MKISAFVLSFAMVCTLLAGVNVVAFAAEEDTVSIFRAYNPNNGEHLYTDAAEYAAVVAQGYNGEGDAWKAPSTSNSPIFRAYNPNSGEHMLASQAEVEALAAVGWNNEGQKMYSDDEQGVAIYRVYNPNASGQYAAGAHHYTANKGEAAGLVAQGWQWDNNGEPVLYGVEAKSVEVKMIDKQGFQTDGTALNTDTLAISYGSDFGVPAKIVWYCDGVAIGVFTADGGAIIDGLNSDFAKDNDGELEVGDYYATVENSQGAVFTTNTVTVVEEGVGVMSEVALSDNYEALATWGADVQAADGTQNKLLAARLVPTTYAAETRNIVVDVTLNKLYDGGKFYVVSTDNETVAKAITTIDPASENTTLNPTGYFKEVTKSKFNGTTLYEENKKDADVRGIFYKESNGKYHFKFMPQNVTTASLTRGENYAVVYSDENVVGKKLESLNKSDELTCPYMMAPDTLTVTDRQVNPTVPGWGATLTFMGMPAAWVSETYDSITAYMATITPGNPMGDPSKLINGITMNENSSVSNEGGAAFPAATNSLAIVGGSAFHPSGMAGQNANYKAVYAKYTGSKDIFGEKVELTSTAAETAIAPLDNMEITECEDDATAADVELTGLRSKASGTVYILKGDADTTGYAELKKKDLSKAVASEHVDGGTQEVTIDDVFSESDLTNAATKNTDEFLAVFVPDDTDVYGTVYDANGSAVGGIGGGIFVLTQEETTYSVSGTTKKMVAKTAAQVTVSDAVLAVKDQFGYEMTIATQIGNFNANAGDDGDMKYVAKDSGDLNGRRVCFQADATTGKIYLSSVGTAQKGDKAYYKLNNNNFAVVECTQAGGPGTAEWTLTISKTAPV